MCHVRDTMVGVDRLLVDPSLSGSVIAITHLHLMVRTCLVVGWVFETQRHLIALGRD